MTPPPAAENKDDPLKVSLKDAPLSSSSSPSSSSSTTTSRTVDILTKSRQELWNMHLENGWLDGARKWCLDPALQFWTILLAPVQHYAVLDMLLARLIQLLIIIPLSWSLTLLAAVFPSSSFKDSSQPQQEHDTNREDNNDARLAAKQDLLLQATPTGPSASAPSTTSSSSSSSSFFMIHPPSDTYSAIQGAMAFLMSATTDFVGVLLDSRRLGKWWQAIMAFSNYLQQSGMNEHLQESIMKPLWRGRLFCNVKILNDIQEMHDCCCDRIQRVSVSTTTRSSTSAQNAPLVQEHSVKEQADLLQEAGRLMRFATAAYGRDMICSAIDRKVSRSEVDTDKKAIVVHTGLKSVDDIPHLVPGRGMDVLRHYIAVDDANKSVVLAIRGTLTLSGALIDVQGMDCEYCLTHGRAHQGIAEQAENIWRVSGAKLQELLLDGSIPKEYRLIITGHSLGAGAACLLHLKIHADKLFPERTVLCYGFAPPPTFALQCPPVKDHHHHHVGTNNNTTVDSVAEAAATMSRKTLQQAMDHSFCFIHDNDCVPFLSVASVQRLSTLLDTVDNQTEHLWFWQRFSLFWEFTSKIPPHIVQAVQAVMKQQSSSSTASIKDVDDSPSRETITKTQQQQQQQHAKLMIPASTVIWMKKKQQRKDDKTTTSNSAAFQAIPCCPTELAQLDIFMCCDMLSDHLPEQYEDALDSLNETTTSTTTTTTS